MLGLTPEPFDRTLASLVELGHDCVWISIDCLCCLGCICCLCGVVPAFIISGQSLSKPQLSGRAALLV